jgi:hypothetical protein
MEKQKGLAQKIDKGIDKLSTKFDKYFGIDQLTKKKK